jgi:hypothetical protein
MIRDLSHLAEREGFESVLRRQTKDLAAHGQQSYMKNQPTDLPAT